MTLLEEYEKQNVGREWERYLEKLPLKTEQTVCDLGCSIGFVTKLLARRVGKVVGFDSNPELLEAAKRQSPTNCDFPLADIQTVDPAHFGMFDGIWMSFALAYMRNPAAFIARWTRQLRDGGWFAVADIDGMFSCHLPKSSRFLSETLQFEEMSEQSGFYDNRIGRKLKCLLEQNGLDVIVEDNDWYDRELNFSGPALPEIAENWEARLGRLRAIKGYYGDRYDDFCREFMAAILDEKHMSHGGVRFCVGIKS